MSINVRFMPDEEIEAEASSLLAGYARKSRTAITVPALLLDDLLQHLGLRLDSCDLHSKYGTPDVLGEIYLKDKLICIDERLDVDERPAMRGRFNFTLAHEIGHWCLHHDYAELWQTKDDLFGGLAQPSIICRTSQKKERREVQADKFAAYLLMPQAQLVHAWQRLRGPEPLRLSDFRSGWAFLSAAASIGRGRFSTDPREKQNDAIELEIQPLADEFQVSPQAMRIRLEQLGMIVRDVETMEALFGAA